MTRPEAPECLPQKTLFQLWKGPGRCLGEGRRAASMWNRTGKAPEILPTGACREPRIPLPPQQKRQGRCLCEYPGSGCRGDCVLPAF